MPTQSKTYITDTRKLMIAFVVSAFIGINFNDIVFGDDGSLSQVATTIAVCVAVGMIAGWFWVRFSGKAAADEIDA